MKEEKLNLAVKSKVICIVKYIMDNENITEDEAYKKFMQMALYQVLQDTDTGLYLEPIEYIIESYCIENKEGREKLLDFISII